MSTYEVNEETLAIVPKNNKSIIYEYDNDNYVVNEESDKIMDDSCRYFGSTLKGRKDGAAALLNTSYKVPILIEDTLELVFFPTSSPRLKNCAWISLNNIKKYEKDSKGSKITFKDGSIIHLNISYGVLNNQILRSSRLLCLIQERKMSKNRKKN